MKKNRSETIKPYHPGNLDAKSLEIISAKYGNNIEDIYALSPGQEWMIGRAKRIVDSFFLQTIIKVVLPLDLENLRKALEDVSLKHPGMRSAFAWKELSEPFQVILKDRKPEVVFLDRSDKTLEELVPELEEFCRKDRERGFDLEDDPLFRLTVFSAKEKNTHAIVLSRPHLIEDGFSEILMMKDLFLNLFLKGKSPLSNVSKVSYSDYAKWLESRDREKDLLYWKDLLAGAKKTSVPGRISFEEGRSLKHLDLCFSDEESERIRKLPGRFHATLGSILHAAWAMLLYGFTGEKDLLFGTVTSGRNREVPGIDRMTGCFMNAFPVRVQIREEESFSALCQRIQNRILISMEKATISPDALGEKLGAENGLFDHFLNFHNYPGIPTSAKAGEKLTGGKLLDMDSYDNLATGFGLYFVPKENKILSRFVYDAEQFEEDAVRKLKDAFYEVMRQILSDAKGSLLCEDIRAPRTLPDLLGMRKNSDHIAAICGTEELTFRQLAKDARQIAEHLKEKGIRKGDRVLLTLGNSLNAMRSIYGVMLAGGVYVSVSVDWPKERFRLVEEETKAALRLTDEMVSGFLSRDLPLTSLPEIREEDEAAIYYTSGSTGRPKGSVLCHRTVMAYTCGEEKLEEFLRRERFLCFPVFSSILSAAVIFIFSSYEKTLVFASAREMQSVDALVECMIRNRIDSMGGIPSFLIRLLMYPPFAEVVKKQVNHFWVGGEAVFEANAQTILDAMKDGELDIVYGSTETYLLSVQKFVPGRPIHLERIPMGTKLYITDEEGNPVPAGMNGEILVGGVPAKYGRYLDPELDREKYFDHPTYGRLFHTNDAGRLLEDGTIQVIGRIDRMIKIHGLRLEPGEIEAVMEQFAGIRSAAVTLKNEQLCGFYIGTGTIAEADLRAFLSKKLPYYMIPSRLMQLTEMPLNPNGKTDYASLPEPEEQAETKSVEATEKETMICRIFEEVLHTEKPVSPDDSFFALGGDSIQALAVAGLLSDEGFRMELMDLFTNPTPRLLSGRLREQTDENDVKGADLSAPSEWIDAVASMTDIDAVESIYPATSVMKNYLENNQNTWPQVYCFEIPASVSPEEVRERLEDLGRKHAALRTIVMRNGGEDRYQVVFKEAKTAFFQADLSRLSEGEAASGKQRLSEKQKQYLSRLIRMEYSPRTELGTKCSLRVGWIRTSEDKAILYLGSSHLTLEGGSVYRLYLELTGQAEAKNDAASVKRHFARLLSEDRKAGMDYWDGLLSGCEGYTELPEKTKEDGERGAFFISGSVGKRFTEKAAAFCKHRKLTLSVFAGFTFGKAMMEVFSLDEVCFPVAGTGRTADEMQIPGMFVAFFPVRLRAADTIQDYQTQLLCSSEQQWILEDPEQPVLMDRTIVLSSQNYYTGLSENSSAFIEYAEIFGAKQAEELMKTYSFRFGNSVLIDVNTKKSLEWMIMFDAEKHDPALLRKLSAEWIRQMKACIPEH